MDYSVKLEAFAGPLDLLLHLIKKNEIDIYDIPIALLTAQYLEYLDTMRALNLDVAGEYLVLAATLVHIKSRLLLPPDEDEGKEFADEEDPRQELVEQLLEYQKYKAAAELLNENSILERDVFIRSAPPLSSTSELAQGQDFREVSIFELISVFQDLLKNMREEDLLELTSDPFSLIDKVNELLEIIKNKKNLSFTELLGEGQTKRNIIHTFLALLEIIKRHLAKVYQAENFGVIRIFSLLEG